MDSLIDFISEILAWLVDLVLWAPLKVYELLLDALAVVLEAIPVPSWLAGGDPFAGIPAGVAWFAAPFELELGITIMLSAYLIRFLIRRIPVVG